MNKIKGFIKLFFTEIIEANEFTGKSKGFLGISAFIKELPTLQNSGIPPNLIASSYTLCEHFTSNKHALLSTLSYKYFQIKNV